MKKIFSLFLFFISIFTSQAQEILSIDSALSISLKKNYDISIARNEANIDKVNNTPGNAGMLPQVAINGTDNYSSYKANRNYFSGLDSSYRLGTNAFNSGIALNWTVFDGGKMFITKNKLAEIEALGEIQFKDRVLQTVFEVIVAYYDVVRQKQQLASLNEVITYNQERVKILQTSFNAGLSPKNNLLQAQIDLNVFKENAINQKVVVIAAKRTLNQLLSRDVDVSYEVADSVPLNYTPDKTELAKKIYDNNTSVLSGQKQVDVAKLSLKEFNSVMLPKINFNAGYNFIQSNYSRGSLSMSRNIGPQIGGSISIPIYQSGNTLRQIKTAKIELESAQFNLENTKLLVNEQLQNALTDFENQQQLLEIEKSNFAIAKENLEITIQRLRFGQTTALEVRQAQESYVDSHTRLINFKYNLKVAEAKLKQLIAEL
jgi:outer membrane protein